MSKWFSRGRQIAMKYYHQFEKYGHLGYFGVLFVEGHTIYAMIGGGLFVVGVVGLLLGEEEVV